MASKFTRGPWRAVRNTIRRRPIWEIRNTHRDPVAVVYTGQPDAELMARSLRLFTELKHLIAIVRLREGDLRASERAALARAEALVDELN